MKAFRKHVEFKFHWFHKVKAWVRMEWNEIEHEHCVNQMLRVNCEARPSDRSRKRERMRFLKGELQSVKKYCLRSDDVWFWLNLIFHCCGNLLSDRRSRVWKWVVSPSEIMESCQWHVLVLITRCKEKNLAHFHKSEWNSAFDLRPAKMNSKKNS